MTVALTLVASLTAACGSAPDAGPPPAGGPGGTADRRAIAASLDDEQARDLAARVNAFGFDLLAELVDDGEANVVTSPVSVTTLLAMALAGAGGQTAEDLAATLHLDGTEVGSEHAGLLFALTDTDDVTVEVANSLWVDAPLERSYLDQVRSVFDAAAEEADLGDPATAERIDEWATDATHGLIGQIAGDLGLPNPQAVLALLNAVYFKGTWTVAFDPEETTDGSFTTAGGDEVTVAFMGHGAEADEEFGYTVGPDGTEALRLPYGASGRFAMDVLLPPADARLADVVADLDAQTWTALTDRLAPKQVQVALPRLDLAYDATLNDALSALGMGVAFSGQADFAPMSPTDPFLDTVAHTAAITVDEHGTEAAAVTGGVMAVSAPPTFRADRPFLFAITDTDTGALLFLGTVTDPTA